MLFSLDSGVPVLPSEEAEIDRENAVCFTGHRETGIIPYRKEPVYSSIRLIGVMPYLRHAERFTPQYKETLADVEKSADVLLTTNTEPSVVYGKKGTGENTSPDVYRDRNYFMVDNASAVISYFNEGSFKSGTCQTLNYAAKQGKIIRRFGLEDAYALIDECGPDIESIRRRLIFMENVFDTPY